MTKKTIKANFVAAIILFSLFLVAGILISIFDNTCDRIIFTSFKDLIPLVLGITAAWLGYCVQRRSAYSQQLRNLWSKLVDAIHHAICYTRSQEHTREQYYTTLLKLSIAIDEIRGVFCNLNETNSERGLYPFEPVKDIYGLIDKLGYDKSFLANEANQYSLKIFAL